MRNINIIYIICLGVIIILLSMTSHYSTHTIIADNTIWPPIPGNMKCDEPIFDVGSIQLISDSIPETTGVIRDVNIVDLITQINESMILGYLQNLTSFGPRVTGETGCIQAAEYLYNEFVNMDLEVRYHNWITGGYNSNNIEATLPGNDPASDDVYIICGHYDTVPGSPGADDDGSGVAAVLTAAQVMRQYEFNHTIRFIAFSGEEEGLYGSYMYVQDAYNNGDDIKGVLNADMIGFALNENQAGSLNVFEDDQSEWLYDFTFHVNELYDYYIDLQLIHAGWTWGSDHYYFWEYGYSALFYHEYEFNHYYHSPNDIIANMNLTYDVKGTRLIVATLASLAQVNSMNSPPNPPAIYGPHFGKINFDYSFSTGAISDPDGDQIFCLWDWDDGSQSSWLGPYDSGQIISGMHQWSEPGVYMIQIKVKDFYGAVSNWSEPFTITITSKVLLIGFVQDVNTSEEAVILSMKLGVQLTFNPFKINRLSFVQVVILNDETQGYIGQRFIFGQFYALVLSD
ncbi:hypothetical protein AYK25_00350 [Thermoplasmatales archaeon SM1-50]|nr:MAG: hypothetical protein AYK25_00350 [Thermoplasmatales archaeon SM1-50]